MTASEAPAHAETVALDEVRVLKPHIVYFDASLIIDAIYSYCGVYYVDLIEQFNEYNNIYAAEIIVTDPRPHVTVTNNLKEIEIKIYDMAYDMYHESLRAEDIYEEEEIELKYLADIAELMIQYVENKEKRSKYGAIIYRMPDPESIVYVIHLTYVGPSTEG